MSGPAHLATYPVIMCGGAGTRLWPASRPSYPKQFLTLVGEQSLFQQTVLRALPLGDGGLVIVAGVAHRRLVLTALAELGVTATVLLEPEPRDSGPAMAAAAAWILTQDPDGMAVFLASDHHIPDVRAFGEAVEQAKVGASLGRIVTLGVRPTFPSSAYGYICAETSGLSPVRAFVEKPDSELAARHLASGYLWNSGNFIVQATTLLAELDAHAPEIADVARDAVAKAASAAFGVEGNIVRLAPGFRHAPKLSIDYAVMEKTLRASVLPVDFSWSDLGAWDDIAATGAGDEGLWIAENTNNALVRVADGMVVATAGVSNVAVIVERDAVLVCDLSHAQSVKGLAARIAAEAPAHRDFQTAPDAALATAGRDFATWMRICALPIWATLGVESDGAFTDRLDLMGRQIAHARRARVQARQVYVYCRAGALGWKGPWRTVAENGLRQFLRSSLRDDAKVRTLIDQQGAVQDDRAPLYDQAFALFALATASASNLMADECQQRAYALHETLKSERLAHGGWAETGDRPYQANAQMHLLEACLAWEAIDDDPRWVSMSDEIVDLALTRFVDPDGGFLREFYGSDWQPAHGEDGSLVEPGHQFEWAWLLVCWARRRPDADILATARRLYAVGLRGVDRRRRVVIDQLCEDFTVRSASARLWPQTEWLKAALILAEYSNGAEREGLLSDASDALAALRAYTEPTGLWRDRMDAEGAFIDEPAPASSLYHIMTSFDQLQASREIIEHLSEADISLG